MIRSYNTGAYYKFRGDQIGTKRLFGSKVYTVVKENYYHKDYLLLFAMLKYGKL